MLFDQQGRRKYLTPAERRAFIGASKKASPTTGTFCLTLVYTGARISEVLALTPQRFDVSAGVVILESLKKRRRGIFRALPVPDDLLVRLEEVHRISAQGSDRLWPWGRTTAWSRVKQIMRETQLPLGSSMPKALRHGFGVAGITEGRVPLNMMQKWLGHSRIATTAIYADAVGAEEREIARRMWQN